jgi:uncharacterized membrane protein
VLFGLEARLGGGATRTANALLMLPFQVTLVWCIWACRTSFAPWLAAGAGLWPLLAFYWEFKFDLVPAALLALGLVLALRGRWAAAGGVLAVGAVVKWTPALAFLTLLVWLVAAGLRRDAARHAVAFVAVAALVYVPFLVWAPSEVAAAYTRQSGRTITPESLWYLPLHAVGLARVRTHISFSAGAPTWANVVAGIIQAALVLGVVACAASVRTSRRAGVAIAGLAPAVFLLTNRIFSPQFILVLIAAWGVGAALLVRERREQLALGIAVAAATAGNAFVYPFALPHYTVTWQAASAVLFGCSIAITAWLLRRALTAARRPQTADAT